LDARTEKISLNRRLHFHSRLGRDEEIMKKGRIDKTEGEE
jgi:hypothetical protein